MIKSRFTIYIEINNGELNNAKKIPKTYTVMNRAHYGQLDCLQPRTEPEDVQVIPRDRIFSRFLPTVTRGFRGGRCPVHGVLLAQTFIS